MRLNFFFFFGLFYNENRKNIWWYMVTYHMPKKNLSNYVYRSKSSWRTTNVLPSIQKNPTTVTITDALPISNRCCFVWISVGSFNCHKIQKTFFSPSLSHWSSIWIDAHRYGWSMVISFIQMPIDWRRLNGCEIHHVAFVAISQGRWWWWWWWWLALCPLLLLGTSCQLVYQMYWHTHTHTIQL